MTQEIKAMLFLLKTLNIKKFTTEEKAKMFEAIVLTIKENNNGIK